MNKLLLKATSTAATVGLLVAALGPVQAIASVGSTGGTLLQDTYVSSAHPNTNYGTSLHLWVQQDTDTLVTYLQYDLHGYPGGYNTCDNPADVDGSLSMGILNPSDGGHVLYRAASDSWTETSLTWNNQPGTTGSVLDTSTANEEASNNVWTSFVVPYSLIHDACNNHNGILSFVVTGGSANAVEYPSKEYVSGPLLTLPFTY